MTAERSILIIYTGGTIGSVHDPHTGSLVPIDFSQITTHVPELNRAGITISAVSFNPPIDSSNVNPSHWRKIANLVISQHEKYDGFVVLHGTDTMSYTASALSFMIEGLRKPVILTGSQLPIGMPRTDGRENLLSAVMLAAHKDPSTGQPTVQEVAIYFGSQLLRGNRTHKQSAESFNAIVSPNYPSLVDAGVDFKINRHALYRGNPGPLALNSRFESKVAWLPFFPGMSFEVFEKLLNSSDLRGVVLSTYGSGNAPDSAPLKSMLQTANNSGVTIVNVTQCEHGGVHPERYATSLMLNDCGVISGGDMTNEAALTKLMMLLGKTDNPDKIRSSILTSIRGERS
jgi:L-asparaginase